MTCRLTDTFAGYFGALNCVAWSPDSRFVVVGGQDDLITIFSPRESRVVARCQGHSAFVTAIAFDHSRGGGYRFGSVGEDGKLILVNVSSTFPLDPSGLVLVAGWVVGVGGWGLDWMVTNEVIVGLYGRTIASTKTPSPKHLASSSSGRLVFVTCQRGKRGQSECYGESIPSCSAQERSGVTSASHGESPTTSPCFHIKFTTRHFTLFIVYLSLPSC